MFLSHFLRANPCRTNRRFRVASGLLSTLLLASGLTGCGEAPAPVKVEDPAQQQLNTAEESRRKLSSAIQRIRPETMATQTRREMVVNSLNSWLASSAESDVEKIKISEQNSVQLSPSALRTATAVRYTENDIVYIRDCLLMKELTESLWKQADSLNAAGKASEQERVVALFRHLMRNMSLLPADSTRIPVGLYEAMLTGMGTVDDRIWAFAEALRQRSLDSVVLQAATPGDPNSADIALAADLLIGVVVEDRLLLFDPLRGTAVPQANDSSAIVTAPAGLESISNLDRWKTGSAFVVCHPAAFSPRMLILQERLEATDSANLYEELVGGTSEIRPLKERLCAVVGAIWQPEALKVWGVPEQRIATAAALNEQQKQAYTLLMRPLDSPFERESLNVGNLLADPSVNEAELTLEKKMEAKMLALEKLLERSDDLFGKPSRRLLTTRVRQIMGSFDIEMIQDLQQIRIACMQEKIELEIPIDDKKAAVVPFVLPKTILDVQRSAVGDTLYWTSMSQVSRNDMSAAVATLRSYRRQYPDEKSFYASLINEAEALMILGDLNGAASALKEAAVDKSPDRARAQWLLMRLGSAAAPAATPAPEKSASPDKPQESATAEPAAEKPAADTPASDQANPAESKTETPAADSQKPADPAAPATDNPASTEPPSGNAPSEK
ncbi:MAG: hypothetical protein U0936_01805 [Planctomycetaceae bacterium]